MAWEMFGEMAMIVESEIGVPAEIFAEAAFGVFSSRPLACAVCDSPHNDATSVCISSFPSDEGELVGPFVLWTPCLPCLELHDRDISSMMAAAEPAIDMWLMTHDVPGSIAVIGEGDSHDCGET